MIKWNKYPDVKPPLTVKGKYEDTSAPLLCLHRDGHLESCILYVSIECDEPFWVYEQDLGLCETVTYWAEINLPE